VFNQVSQGRITLDLDKKTTILVDDILHLTGRAGDANETRVEMCGVCGQFFALIPFRIDTDEHCQSKTPQEFTYVTGPKTTLLYQIVQEYWPEFQAELANHGKYLPAYVIKEFDEYLKCGRLEHGFLRVRFDSCHDEKLVAFSCKKRGFYPSCGARLNLNINFHMLFLDCVYTGGAKGQPMRFLNVKSPMKADLIRLTHTIAQRIGRYLERQGLVERDTGNLFLT